MATFRLSNKILDLDGTPIPNVEVAISLFPKAAFRIDTGSEIAAIETIHSDSAGAWTVVIEGNENINPSGSYYEIEERIPKRNGGTRVWRARLVGDSGLVDALTPQPIPPGSVPNYATIEWVSENFLRKGDVVAGAPGPPGPPGYTGFISSTVIPASSSDIGLSDVIIVEVPFTGVKGRMYHLSGWLNLKNQDNSTSYATITMNDGVNILYTANETSINGEYDTIPLDINFATGSENRNVRIQLKIRITPLSPSSTAAARVIGGNLLLEDIGEQSQAISTVGMVQPSVFNTAWGKIGETRYTAGPVTNTANPIPVLGSLAIDAKRYKDRRYKITAYVVAEVAAAGQAAIFQITRNGTPIQSKTLRYSDNANLVELLITEDCLSDDTVTYAVAVDNSGAGGGVKLDGSVNAPSFIMVEDFGPVSLAAPENWPPNFPVYGSQNVGSGGFANDSVGLVATANAASQPTLPEANAWAQIATVAFRGYKNHKYSIEGYVTVQGGTVLQTCNVAIAESLSTLVLTDTRSQTVGVNQSFTIPISYILDPATYAPGGIVPSDGMVFNPVARGQVVAASGQTGLKAVGCRFQVFDLGIQGVPTPDGVSGPSVWNVGWGLMATLPPGSLGTVTIPTNGTTTPVTNNTTPVTLVAGRKYQVIPSWSSFLGPAGSTASIQVVANPGGQVLAATISADVGTSGFGELNELFRSNVTTADITFNVQVTRMAGGPMTMVAGSIYIYDIGPTAARPDAFWPASGGSGGGSSGGGGGNESVGVVWDAAFPGQVVLTGGGNWVELGRASWQGLAGHAYEIKGYATYSTGASADSATTQVIDLNNPGPDAYGPTVSMFAYNYASAILTQIVECGNTARTMTVQARGSAITGTFGAKLEHGHMTITDLGIQGTATPMGYYSPSIWNVAWGQIARWASSLGDVTAPTATGGGNAKTWIQSGSAALVAGRKYKITPSWTKFQGASTETVVLGINMATIGIFGYWYTPWSSYSIESVDGIYYDCLTTGTYNMTAYVERVGGTGNVIVNGKEIIIEDVGPAVAKAPAYWVPAAGPSIWESSWGVINNGTITQTGAFTTSTAVGFTAVTWKAIAGRKYKIHGWVISRILGGANTFNLRMQDTIAGAGIGDVSEGNQDGYQATIPFEGYINCTADNAAYKVDLQGWVDSPGGSTRIERGVLAVDDMGPVTPGQSYKWPPINATFPTRVTSTTRPSAPVDGDMIFETDTKRLFNWNAGQNFWRGIRSSRYRANGVTLNTSGTVQSVCCTLVVPDQGCYGMLTIWAHCYIAMSNPTDSIWLRIKDGASEVSQWRSPYAGTLQVSSMTADFPGEIVMVPGTAKTVNLVVSREGGSGFASVYADPTLHALYATFTPDT